MRNLYIVFAHVYTCLCILSFVDMFETKYLSCIHIDQEEDL